MGDELQERDSQAETLEAYRILIDFQKWTYDTYQRDARLFLAIEVVALGLVASSFPDPKSTLNLAMISIASALGILLTVAWASRQRREYYMSKGRLERLRELEVDMAPSFRYFTTTYPQSRKRCEAVSRLPLIGERLRLLPHPYRYSAFLKSLLLQQVFLVLWILVVAAVVVKVIQL